MSVVISSQIRGSRASNKACNELCRRCRRHLKQATRNRSPTVCLDFSLSGRNGLVAPRLLSLARQTTPSTPTSRRTDPFEQIKDATTANVRTIITTTIIIKSVILTAAIPTSTTRGLLQRFNIYERPRRSLNTISNMQQEREHDIFFAMCLVYSWGGV